MEALELFWHLARPKAPFDTCVQGFLKSAPALYVATYKQYRNDLHSYAQETILAVNYSVQLGPPKVQRHNEVIIMMSRPDSKLVRNKSVTRGGS